MRFLIILLLTAAAAFSQQGVDRRDVNNFNPLTDLPWEEVWIAGVNSYNTGTTLATDGQTVENWGDATDGSAVLTQATAGKRPLFRASDAAFGGRPLVQGVRASATSLQWNRGSALAPPYTIVVVGAHETGVSNFTSVVTDYSLENNYVFGRYITAYSTETTYMNAVYRYAAYFNAETALWNFETSATTTQHHIGKNGLQTVPKPFTATNFTGFNLFRYSTSDTYPSSGKVAFLGIAASGITGHAKWPRFLQWVQSYYKVPFGNRATIICDGDSRTDGYTYLDASQWGKMWMHVVHARLSDKATVIHCAEAGREMATQITDEANRLIPAIQGSPSLKKIVICHSPAFNDVWGGTSAATCYQRVCDYVRDVHEQGALCLLTTTPKRTGWTAAAGTRLADLNTLILANAGDGGGGASSIADGIADIADDADTTSANPWAWSADTTPYTAANYNADKVHYSTAGNVLIADDIEVALRLAPFNVD